MIIAMTLRKRKSTARYRTIADMEPRRAGLRFEQQSNGANVSMQKKITSRDAAAVAANLMFAPAVMWMRIPTMLSEPRKAGRLGVETMRAIDEKTKAVAVGAAAAQASLTNAAFLFWPELLAGKTPSLWSGEAAENAVNATLLPVGKRVKANFDRLSSFTRK